MGQRGSPCRKPLDGLKKPVGAPLIKIAKEEEETSWEINLQTF
jgi:hypothetical protein